MWAIKNNVFTLFIAFIGVIGSAQTTAIPDSNFEQALIDLGLDSGPLDGLVTTANINKVSSLTIPDYAISDLTGIEDFSSLTQLYCYNNQITSLDLSLNTNLEILWCYNNQLTTLDLTNNTNIIALDCSSNQINTIDITPLTVLVHFVCANNQLTGLNLSQNSNLDILQCENNVFTNLDVTSNINLTQLSCQNNQISSLDLSANRILNTLNCSLNQLVILDLSQNSNLTQLNCSHNNLCQLNIRNNNTHNLTADFTNNPNLNCVVTDNVNAIPSQWTPASFTNYVSSSNMCSNFINVDVLNNVTTNTSYILPVLGYGNYFTQPGSNGTPLFSGDIITTSQTIYIYNSTVCGTNESSFHVFINDEALYIPKFFTPNNDGNNDVWKILDANNAIVSITIFNRYGKLLKTLLPNYISWDGTFRGKLLPTNDYWYVITLNTGEKLKGHFTLKR